MPGQRVVVGVALVAACAGVAVLLAPEGVDRQAGGAAIGRTAQDALAYAIVHVPFLVGGPGIPFGKVVLVVVGEGAGGAPESAATYIAKAIVARGVDLPRLVRAGSSGGLEPGELMRLAAIVVEVLVLTALCRVAAVLVVCRSAS